MMNKSFNKKSTIMIFIIVNLYLQSFVYAASINMENTVRGETLEINNRSIISPNTMGVIEKWSVTVDDAIHSSPVVADLDKDGYLDIVIGTGFPYIDFYSGKIYCLEYNGEVKWIKEFDMYIISSPAIADIDNDGYLEIIFGCGNGFIYCLNYKGAIEWEFDTGSLSIYGTPCIADLDMNGYFEIIIATRDPSNSYIFCINYDGTEKWRYAGGSGYIHSNAAVADLDNDRKLEIIIGADEDKLLCIDHKGTLNWSFTATGLGVFGITCSPIVQDLDNDKNLEIVFGDWGNKTYCLDNTGNLKWTYIAEDQAFMTSPVVADVDNDGGFEIICNSINQDNYGLIHCINHDGSFEWKRTYLGLSVLGSSPTIADLDDDGELNIIFSMIDNTTYCTGSNGYIEWTKRTGATGSNLQTIEFSTPLVVDLDKDNIFEIILGTEYFEGTNCGKIICLSLTGVSSSGAAPYHCYRGSMFRNGWMDSDGDLIDDLTEYWYFDTNPYNADDDSDDLSDGEEYFYNTNPKDSDTDEDGYSDGEEIAKGTDPTNSFDFPAPDSDEDGLNDEEEATLGTDPNDDDSDNDGLKDGDEINIYFTNATNSDTDFDELPDGDEIDKYETDPTDEDTDDDGMPDGYEIEMGFYPTFQPDGNMDQDIDDLCNVDEWRNGTNPLIKDTDGDGFSDGEEVHIHGTDPLDPFDHPFKWNFYMTIFSVVTGVLGFGGTIYGYIKAMQKRKKKKEAKKQKEKELAVIQEEFDSSNDFGIEED